MGNEDPIQKILQNRRQSTESLGTPPQAEEGDKFFSILIGDSHEEQFLELRFRAGMRTCFSYGQLEWFNFDPEASMMDLEFGGYLVTLKGRGLGERLFDGIKRKRVSWIQEADVEMQDHSGNKVYIEEILITPPSTEGDGEAEATPT